MEIRVKISESLNDKIKLIQALSKTQLNKKLTLRQAYELVMEEGAIVKLKSLQKYADR